MEVVLNYLQTQKRLELAFTHLFLQNFLMIFSSCSMTETGQFHERAVFTSQVIR